MILTCISFEYKVAGVELRAGRSQCACFSLEEQVLQLIRFQTERTSPVRLWEVEGCADACGWSRLLSTVPVLWLVLVPEVDACYRPLWNGVFMQLLCI